jgi:hypothetical protein
LEPETIIAAPGDSDLILHAFGRRAVISVVDEDGRQIRSAGPWLQLVKRRPDGGFQAIWRGARSSDLCGVLTGEPIDGGRWVIELPESGCFGVEVSCRDEDHEGRAESTLTLEDGASLVESTIVLREVPYAGILEIYLVDAKGEPIPSWSGSLFSEPVGWPVERFTQEGILRTECLGPPYYAPLHFLAGSYRLRIKSEWYDLPVERAIDLKEGRALRIRLQSPGVGGRLRVVRELEGASDTERTTKGLALELRCERGDETPLTGLYQLFRDFGEPAESLSLWSADDPEGWSQSTLLLRPGEWAWQLRSGEGEPITAGNFTIVVGAETLLALDLDD